jgi:hypothetical protein
VKIRALIAASGIVVGGLVLRAQNAASPEVPVMLGQSVVALNGPWKFHTGDDPRWADPAFDDFEWKRSILLQLRSSPSRLFPYPALSPDGRRAATRATPALLGIASGFGYRGAGQEPRSLRQ